jgi:hypothetical protein
MAFGRRVGKGSGESAAQLEARLREHQAALEQSQANVAALEQERAAAVDARDVAGTDTADRKLTLAARELEAIQRGVERLTEQLAQARESEALERKRAFVEYVRKLAADAVKKVERRLAISEELRAITTELSAIEILVREANTPALELGLEKIPYPTAGLNGGIRLTRTAEDELAVGKRAKELRTAVAA